MPQIQLYDSTLRDGAQREGVSFSVVDKLNITRKLDELGVHYIEGGWPASNPKDEEFFQRARELKLANAILVAFGSTRRAHTRPEADANLNALAVAGTGTVTIVGKSSAPQVTQVLETSLEENLSMITDSVRYLKGKGLTVFLDAEHFFDGFKADRDYALRCLTAAEEAGASCLILCDTNGGALPSEVMAAVKAAKAATGVNLGIHTHNDGELAVANSLVALNAGAIQVQGTINGFGERCGNANLCSIIGNLKLKMGIDCITDEQLARLTEVSNFVSEAANLAPDPFRPYVGASAFSHKAGLHVHAMAKWANSYQHVDPAQVGNRRRAVVSELSGRQNIILKARELGIDLSEDGTEVRKLLERVKLLESRGFQYDNAEASMELLFHRTRPDYKAPFELVDFMVVIETRRRAPTRNNLEETLAEAMIKVKVGTEIIHTAAEGNGPVNALDQALRKALIQYYPNIAPVKLVDYKVRILEESTGTESQVRVLIESSDGDKEWRTVGSSTNIIEASWLALADSLEYWLLKQSTPSV
ncbi:MAG: citramalate synthase [Chloroflexi bacterium]|nr:citramalate synthase [Chloroflexota bacterium]